jgi:hypothetical protein
LKDVSLWALGLFKEFPVRSSNVLMPWDINLCAGSWSMF